MIQSKPKTFADHLDIMISCLDRNDAELFNKSYYQALEQAKGTEMEVRLKLVKIDFDRHHEEISKREKLSISA